MNAPGWKIILIQFWKKIWQHDERTLMGNFDGVFTLPIFLQRCENYEQLIKYFSLSSLMLPPLNCEDFIPCTKSKFTWHKKLIPFRKTFAVSIFKFSRRETDQPEIEYFQSLILLQLSQNATNRFFLLPSGRTTDIIEDRPESSIQYFLEHS